MHAMNELQRQRYLSALGVESYAPRWLLPGAPEPVLCTRLPVAAAEGEPEPANLPADAQPGAASSDVSTELRTLSGRVPETRGEPRGSTEAPQALSDVLRQIADSEAAPAALQSPAARPPEKQNALPVVAPFTLSIWRSSLPVLVLDSREPKAAMPTERLLRNLLRSLGEVDTASIHEEILTCPLVPRATPADARSELSAWLDAELTRRPVQKVLLMGQNAARYLVAEDSEHTVLQWLSLPGFEVRALTAPSLVDLLRDPSQKRSLWRALQTEPED